MRPILYYNVELGCYIELNDFNEARNGVDAEKDKISFKRFQAIFTVPVFTIITS